MQSAPADRAVFTDDGKRLLLTLYAAAGNAASVEISPLLAVGLAGEMIEAAHRHLSAASSRPHARTRGGDPKAERRVKRDEALRDVAALLGADLSLEQRAAEVIARARRYRPAPLDDSTGSAERKVLRRLADVGLPLPGRRQLRRILSIAAAGHPGHPLAMQNSTLDVKPAAPLPEP